MAEYVFVALLSGVLASVAQILLKKSSNIKRNSWIREYLNLHVICGYGLIFVSMVLMVVAYKGLPYKYGTILEALAYLYIMVLSRIFLKEKLTLRKILGNCIIVCGVIVFSI